MVSWPFPTFVHDLAYLFIADRILDARDQQLVEIAVMESIQRQPSTHTGRVPVTVQMNGLPTTVIVWYSFNAGCGKCDLHQLFIAAPVG